MEHVGLSMADVGIGIDCVGDFGRSVGF